MNLGNILFRRIVDTFILVLDLLKLKFGRVPTPDAYKRLLASFFLFGGGLNWAASRILGRKKSPFRNVGILEKFSESELEFAHKHLAKNGYFIFENALTAEECDRILASSLAIPGLTRKMDGGIGEIEHKYFDRVNPTSVRFDYDANDLLADENIQSLVFDESLFGFAQRYLKSSPILDAVVMWWHTPFGAKPDKEAAQWFHFDMERLKWIKFFFYITDVDEKSGPHTFVSKSHKPLGIPSKLRRKGYVRLSDDEVLAHYPKNQIIEFTGKRGTLIVEDTQGLHKGKHCELGDRLVFNLEYTTSMFGAPIPKLEISRANLKPTIRETHSNFPHAFQCLTIVD
jgi:ectoine hydroxylase-related dioxygenase (phytanoyl-CoA dioxygenase family)